MLEAQYTSPTGSKSFRHTLPTASATSVAEKTAYFAALREKTGQLQGEINVVLTQKMEEDLKIAAEDGPVKKSPAEERAEELYGEENGEEEG